MGVKGLHKYVTKVHTHNEGQSCSSYKQVFHPTFPCFGLFTPISHHTFSLLVRSLAKDTDINCRSSPVHIQTVSFSELITMRFT
jgi:hypothetical protein